jgi:hypothetical protein
MKLATTSNEKRSAKTPCHPFYLILYMLIILIKRAKEDEQINKIILHLVDDRLSILQYVNDTIIFLDHNLEQAKNIKLLFSVFKQDQPP